MADASSDIVDNLKAPFRKAYSTLSKVMGDTEKPAEPKKVDDSYSRQMLKAANDSFTKASANPKLGQTAKKTTKTAAKKKTARKR